VLTISVPAIIANSSVPLVGLVDTWAVGHLPGAVHLAAVGLGSVVFNYIFWAFGFLRMGTTGLTAQAWGCGNLEELARVVLRSTALALLIGLSLWLLGEWILALALRAMAPPEGAAELMAQYFRIRIWAAPATLFTYTVTGVLFGLGRTRAVLALQVLLNLTNALLNLLLVVGLDMGVPGVAWGTLIAQWLAAALGVWLLRGVPGAESLLSLLTDRRSWRLPGFRPLIVLNGFIFVRTLFLMTALALVMRESAQLGSVEMAASHVVNQYMMLMALGLDGFAHAAEALAGAAWGKKRVAEFQGWVRLTGLWAAAASLAYAAVFWLAGGAITALLTDIEAVRLATATVMPMVVALPVIAVWCYQFDGVYIGATAAAPMMVTMGLAFALFVAVLGRMTGAWGLQGLWGAVLLFMAARGVFQAVWYPKLLARLRDG